MMGYETLTKAASVVHLLQQVVNFLEEGDEIFHLEVVLFLNGEQVSFTNIGGEVKVDA